MANWWSLFWDGLAGMLLRWSSGWTTKSLTRGEEGGVSSSAMSGGNNSCNKCCSCADKGSGGGGGGGHNSLVGGGATQRKTLTMERPGEPNKPPSMETVREDEPLGLVDVCNHDGIFVRISSFLFPWELLRLTHTSRAIYGCIHRHLETCIAPHVPPVSAAAAVYTPPAAAAHWEENYCSKRGGGGGALGHLCECSSVDEHSSGGGEVGKHCMCLEKEGQGACLCCGPSETCSYKWRQGVVREEAVMCLMNRQAANSRREGGLSSRRATTAAQREEGERQTEDGLRRRRGESRTNNTENSWEKCEDNIGGEQKEQIWRDPKRRPEIPVVCTECDRRQTGHSCDSTSFASCPSSLPTAHRLVPSCSTSPTTTSTSSVVSFSAFTSTQIDSNQPNTTNKAARGDDGAKAVSASSGRLMSLYRRLRLLDICGSWRVRGEFGCCERYEYTMQLWAVGPCHGPAMLEVFVSGQVDWEENQKMMIAGKLNGDSLVLQEAIMTRSSRVAEWSSDVMNICAANLSSDGLLMSGTWIQMSNRSPTSVLFYPNRGTPLPSFCQYEATTSGTFTATKISSKRPHNAPPGRCPRGGCHEADAKTRSKEQRTSSRSSGRRDAAEEVIQVGNANYLSNSATHYLQQRDIRTATERSTTAAVPPIRGGGRGRNSMLDRMFGLPDSMSAPPRDVEQGDAPPTTGTTTTLVTSSGAATGAGETSERMGLVGVYAVESRVASQAHSSDMGVPNPIVIRAPQVMDVKVVEGEASTPQTTAVVEQDDNSLPEEEEGRGPVEEEEVQQEEEEANGRREEGSWESNGGGGEEEEEAGGHLVGLVADEVCGFDRLVCQ
eukprot:GHVS01057424.1.p1 GENE.GHVS01057424.1~~GHVS01057424.1.p1  ORF type:complete len:835 (-),score=205.67 GHVS01057424.1:458-2962(-)